MSTHNVTRDTVHLYCEGLLTDAKLCREIERQLKVPNSNVARWASEAADELGPSAETRTTIRSQFARLREELTSERDDSETTSSRRPAARSKVAARSQRKAPAAHSLAAATRQEASVELDQPLMYSDGVLTVNVKLDDAPYGVIDVQVVERDTHREVTRFCAVAPLHKRIPNRRYAKIVVAARLPKNVDPASVTPWVAFAGDKDSLAAFDVDEVKKLLDEPAVKSDSKLQASLERLLDELR